jgi:hypothetical protein
MNLNLTAPNPASPLCLRITPLAPGRRYGLFGAMQLCNQSKDMKRMMMNRILSVCSIAFLAATAGTLRTARSQDNTRTQQTIPLIQMENVPLVDAIKNLARQSDLNFILDPKLSSPWLGAQGKSGPATSVTVRWENLSAEEALQKLLKEHGLEMVSNPATSIARIAFTNQAVTPLPVGTLGGSTNPILPLVSMTEVPLNVAIKNLAARAHLRLAMDESLLVPSGQPAGRPFLSPTVSVRWQNVTARQALAALLDNYDLLLVEDPATASAKVVAKPQPAKSAQGK